MTYKTQTEQKTNKFVSGLTSISYISVVFNGLKELM